MGCGGSSEVAARQDHRGHQQQQRPQQQQQQPPAQYHQQPNPAGQHQHQQQPQAAYPQAILLHPAPQHQHPHGYPPHQQQPPPVYPPGYAATSSAGPPQPAGGQRTRGTVDAEGWERYDPSAFDRQRGFVDEDTALAQAIARSLATAEEERNTRDSVERSRTTADDAPPVIPHQAAQPQVAFVTGDNDPFCDADLALLPRLRYDPRSVGPSDDETMTQCALCFDDYSEGADIMLLPCFHRFHAECASDWLKRKPECPICKSNPKHTGGSAILV